MTGLNSSIASRISDINWNFPTVIIPFDMVKCKSYSLPKRKNNENFQKENLHTLKDRETISRETIS